MPTEVSHNEGRAVVVGAPLAVLCGLGAAVQGRMNGSLSTSLGAPVVAAVWSFGSGWLMLALGLLVLPRARRGLAAVARAVRARHLQWWEILGGLGGGFFVAVQTYAVPLAGVAMFTIATVGGQTANALLVDRLGLGPAGRTPVTVGRVVAALATFAGVAVASSARGGTGASTPVLALVLAVLAGAGMAVQQAINGKVNLHSRDPWATTFVNFSWGLLALLLYAAVQLGAGRVHLPSAQAMTQLPWWSLLGGVIGCIYIAVMAVVVRTLGVLLMALLALTGQLVGAVLLDLMTPGAQVTPMLLLGVAITLLAAGGAGVAAQRSRRAGS